MIVTHCMLSAYFLSALFVSATPIPTPPQLLPCIYPDHLSSQDTPVCGTVLNVPSAIQVRDGLWTTPAHLATQDVPEIHEEAGINGMEIHMENSGLSSQRLVSRGVHGGISGPNPGSSHEYDSAHFHALFEHLDDVGKDPEESSKTIKKITSDLQNIEDAAISLVGKTITQDLAFPKNDIAAWTPASELEPSLEQRAAVAGIRLWEKELRLWSKERKFDYSAESYYKTNTKEFLKSVMEITQVDFQISPKIEGFEELVNKLRRSTMDMSIDDTRELYQGLQEAASHIQKALLPTWEAKIKRQQYLMESTKKSLEKLRRVSMVFGSPAKP